MQKTLLTIIAILTAITGFAQEKNVAVMAPFDFEDKVELMYENLIKSKLTEIIAEAEGYKAFSRTDINAIIDEHHFQRTGQVKDEEIRKIGEMTGATHICVSDVTTADNYMTIAARIIKIETAEVEIEKSVFPKAEPEDINKGCIKLANKLVGRESNNYGNVDNDYSEKKGTLKDHRDGKTYKWVRIGEQVWMAENLNYYTSSGSWCYDDKSSNCDKYGRLYDWETAKKACPTGWHLPSDVEWKELEMSFGMSQAEADDIGYRGTNEGSKLAGNAGLWHDGDLDQNSEFGSSGFTALPGGECYNYGNFDYIGNYGSWWSATEGRSSYAWYRALGYSSSDVYRGGMGKEGGFSVRCLRD